MNTKAPEVIEVESARIACDGGQGALGHPRVWLSVGKPVSSNALIATAAMS